MAETPQTCQHGLSFKVLCPACTFTPAAPSLEGPPITAREYAEAASVIHLYLAEFCDESLVFPDMIADAARKAAAELSALRSSLEEARKDSERLDWIDANEVECDPASTGYFISSHRALLVQMSERGIRPALDKAMQRLAERQPPRAPSPRDEP